MVEFDLHLEETNRQHEGGHDRPSSEHLPYRACDEVERDVGKGRVDDVSGCRNGEEEDVDFELFSFGFCLEGPHLVGLLVSALEEVVDYQG